MRKTFATVSFSGLLEAKLEAIAKAGFQGIELLVTDVEAFSGSPSVIRRLCDELNLQIEVLQPLRNFEGNVEVEPSENLQRARRLFETMRLLGTDLVLLCSNVLPTADGCAARCAEELRRLADEAARHRVRIAFEALSWGTHINRAEQAWAMVKRVDHPSFGLAIDSFHMFAVGEEPDFIRTIPAHRLFLVQLADAPRLDMDLLSWSRHHRCLPGRGDFDLVGFMSHLRATRYDGPLSLEVFSDDLKRRVPRDVAMLGMQSLRRLENASLYSPGLRDSREAHGATA